MSIFAKLAAILGGIQKYGALATAAVAQVEQEVGPGNGETKRQLAVSYILAAAHAGEAVPVAQVQAIATAVDFAVGIANSLGIFGKTHPPTATVSVPADASIAAAA